jgi:hypothetical protein
MSGIATPDHTVPTGRFSRWTLYEALRARLQSCCPSGTKNILRATKDPTLSIQEFGKRPNSSPGTLCQATITLSLRDISQQALAKPAREKEGQACKEDPEVLDSCGAGAYP